MFKAYVDRRAPKSRLAEDKSREALRQLRIKRGILDWSPKECAIVKKHYPDGAKACVEALAAAGFKRSKGQIYYAVRTFKLCPPKWERKIKTVIPWTKKQEAWLFNNYEMANDATLLAGCPGHTITAIRYRAHKLGALKFAGKDGHLYDGSTNKLIDALLKILKENRHSAAALRDLKFRSASCIHRWRAGKGPSLRVDDLQKILNEFEYELVIQPMEIKNERAIEELLNRGEDDGDDRFAGDPVARAGVQQLNDQPFYPQRSSGV